MTSFSLHYLLETSSADSYTRSPGGKGFHAGRKRLKSPGQVLLLERPRVFCSLKQVTGPGLSLRHPVPCVLQGLRGQEYCPCRALRAVPGPGEAATPFTAPPPSRHSHVSLPEPSLRARRCWSGRRQLSRGLPRKGSSQGVLTQLRNSTWQA